MKYLLFVVMFALVGCGDLIRVDPPNKDKAPPKTLEESIQQTEEANARADAAIKTSADAKSEAVKARQEAKAAYAVGDAATKRADGFEKEAKKIHEEEVATKIFVASWWTFAIGALTTLVGIFLCVRFPSKTSLAIAVSGAGVACLGLVGVWLAPHWMMVAWVSGAALLIGLAGGMAFLLHGHQTAVRDVWNMSEDDIRKNPRLVKLLGKAGVKV